MLPSGFSANNRYTDFDGESFFTGSSDDEYGSANCPKGTDVPVNLDYLGGGGASRNFAPDWFCHH